MSRTFLSDAAVGIAALAFLWRALYEAISYLFKYEYMTVPFGYRLLGILWSPAKGGLLSLPCSLSFATPSF